MILARDRVMLRITISKTGEPPRTKSFDKREITVGRTPSNDLQISEPGVSSSHARILNMDGALTIIDLESTNGTFVNGQRIRGPHIVQPHDEVYICSHKLQFDLAASAPAPQPYGVPPRPDGQAPAWPGPPPMAPLNHGGSGGAPSPPQPPSMPPPIGAPPPAPAPYGSAPPPPVGPPMQGPPMMSGPPPLHAPSGPAGPPSSMRGPPSDAPPPPIGAHPGIAEPPRLAVPSPVGVGGPMRSSGHGEPPTLPPMLEALGTSDTHRPPGFADPIPPRSMPPSVPPPPPAEPRPSQAPPPPVSAAPPPVSAPPPPIADAPPPLSMPPPIDASPEPPSFEADAPPPLDEEPPAVLEPIDHAPPEPPAAPEPAPAPAPARAPSMPPVVVDAPASSPPPASAAGPARSIAVASTPPGTPDRGPDSATTSDHPPDPVPVRSGATVFADDVLPLVEPSSRGQGAPTPRGEPAKPRPQGSRRSGVIEAKSGPTSPGLAPPPSPPGRESSPASGLARPSPVSPLQHSAPLSLAADVTLGRPEDLAGLDPDEQLREACARVFAVAHDRLLATTDEPLEPSDLREQIRADLQVFAQHYRHVDVAVWTDRMVEELFGLGPLEAVLADAEVREVFVHGPDRALARRGSTPPSSIGATFSCPQAIEAVVRRLTGTAFGIENPVVDARTFGGQEVYAVHETVAAGGPVVNIRIPGAHDLAYSLSHMVATGAMTPSIAQLLEACVRAGLNIAICAGPGAQAFPLLAALAEAAPQEERQLLVRPAHEPGLLPANTVVLEGAGLVGTEGGGSVMQALVRTAMGLAPDRLLVHDIAGPEAADVFAAMGRGLQGTIITLRASTTGAGLARLGTLIGLAGGSSDVSTRTLYAAQAIELIITVSRFADGHHRVTQVSEPVLSPTGTPMTVDLVTIDPQTRNWTHTGVVPTFAQELQRRGIRVDMIGQ